MAAGALALALGPHPQRELTLIPRLGFPCPRLGMAAGALALALGPHPQRELTLIPRLGFPCPRLGMAAGALALALGPSSLRSPLRVCELRRTRRSLGEGGHPQRELTLTLRRGVAWPQRPPSLKLWRSAEASREGGSAAAGAPPCPFRAQISLPEGSPKKGWPCRARHGQPQNTARRGPGVSRTVVIPLRVRIPAAPAPPDPAAPSSTASAAVPGTSSTAADRARSSDCGTRESPAGSRAWRGNS